MAAPRKLTVRDLRRAVGRLREFLVDRPLAEDHELFVAWFLHATCALDEEQAAASLTGIRGDAGADAVLIDRPNRIVNVVQGKYRARIEGASEPSSELRKFTDLSRALLGSENDFEAFCRERRPHALPLDRLRKARRALAGDHWRLRMYYATTGKVGAKIRKESERRVRRQKRGEIEFFAGKRILRLLEEYISGVSPRIAEATLEIKSPPSVTTTKPLHRLDRVVGVEAWMFGTAGSAVADLYEQWGDPLFARNVRGFLGENAVNSRIGKTIRGADAPAFWYYNNGVTIVCEDARITAPKGKGPRLVMNGPQIINGQQTTKELHASKGRAGRVEVLVRVIKIPPSTAESPARSRPRDLVGNIVIASNWQNKISNVDLKANDDLQVILERSMRRIGYFYRRKRMTKSEAIRKAGAGRILLTKEEIAYSVVATDMDPGLVVRPGEGGKEQIFGDRLYRRVFNRKDPYFYLIRYWFMRAVKARARLHQGGRHAKWLVLNFLWAQARDTFRTEAKVRAIVAAAGAKKSRIPAVLAASSAPVFRAAMAFYRRERGAGGEAVDHAAFFKRKAAGVPALQLHRAFLRFWRSAHNTQATKFQQGWRRASKVIHSIPGWA